MRPCAEEEDALVLVREGDALVGALEAAAGEGDGLGSRGGDGDALEGRAHDVAARRGVLAVVGHIAPGLAPLDDVGFSGLNVSHGSLGGGGGG